MAQGWVVLAAWLLLQTSAFAELRINQIQFVGSHNSYKQAMSAPYRSLLGWVNEDAARALDYAHVPLHQQLDLGLRKLELDVFYRRQTEDFPVGHVQVIDMNSHCSPLTTCLQELRSWSVRHPDHAPIWISLNAKDQVIDWLPHPEPFDQDAFALLDRRIEAVLGDRLIRPKHVILVGQAKPIWPPLDQARGKFLLILDESGAKRDLYLSGWRQRPMFVAMDSEHAAAAVWIVNDPMAEQARIRQLVRRGFMVRTRADADTVEARNNDIRRRDAAFSSGAQAVSTDYYLPTNTFGNDYRVWITGGLRCNPIAAPASCDDKLIKR